MQRPIFFDAVAAAQVPSHHDLRVNASTASSRSRHQQTNLFAPSLSRKTTSWRATLSFERKKKKLVDEVSDAAENLGAALQQQQRRQLRHARQKRQS